MTDTLPTMTHPLLLHGDCIADVFEKMDMAPKARKCELTVAHHEESMSLSTTCPATPEEHPGSPASRSCSPGGSKRGRDDTIVQEESDLSLVSRKLQRMVLSGEKLEIMIPDAYEDEVDEGTDFDWLCPEACVSA